VAGRVARKPFWLPIKLFSFPYGNNGRESELRTAILRQDGLQTNIMPPNDQFGLQRLAMGQIRMAATLLDPHKKLLSFLQI
jgi:hypothetical protein